MNSENKTARLKFFFNLSHGIFVLGFMLSVVYQGFYGGKDAPAGLVVLIPTVLIALFSYIFYFVEFISSLIRRCLDKSDVIMFLISLSAIIIITVILQ